MIEISGEFHFFVSDGRNFRQCAIEVLLHQVAHRIELQPNFVNLVIVGGECQAAREQGSGGHRTQKSSSVHLEFSSLHLIDSVIAGASGQSHVGQ